jgi:disulfide bond formation protein DsbB
VGGLIELTRQALPFLTLTGLILIILLLALLATLALKARKSPLTHINTYMKKHALKFSFIIAIIATLGSLFYSEILGLNPCPLCWYQRILMYPLALITGTALLTKSKNYKIYMYPFTLLGILVAALHYTLQVFTIPAACGPGAVTCETIYFAAYGFITIPFMALTAFILILLLTLLNGKK